MAETVLEIMTQIIKFIFMERCLSKVSEKNNEKRNYWLLFLFCILIYLGIPKDNFRVYLLINSVVYILLFILANRKSLPGKLAGPLVAFLLLCYEIVIFFSSFFSVIIISVFSHILQKETAAYPILTTVLTVSRGGLAMVMIYVIEKGKNYLKDAVLGKYIIISLYFAILSIKIPFLYTNIADYKAMKGMVIAILSCCLVFATIIVIKEQKAAKEKIRMEESIKGITTRLHQTQELYPVLLEILSEITENADTHSKTKDAIKLLNEVEALYGAKVRENKKDDLALKNFCSTGLELLDRQLMMYQREAIEKNINLDIIVSGSVKNMLYYGSIEQLRFQRTLGDLMRNSFRAIEKNEETKWENRRILVIIGSRQENILELVVADSGVNFPATVLNTFGTRGVSIGGTGNGLADVAEFVQEMRASLYLQEYNKDDTYTKKISVVFNQKGEHIFISSWRSIGDSSFWK